MKKIKVAVILGGISSEREISLVTGQAVIDNLDREKYNISRYDPKTDLAKLIQDKNKIDVAFIALHGPFGEDGTIQGFLELLAIPYTFSGVLASALAMDKHQSMEIYKAAGIPTPKHILVTNPNDKISTNLPVVVKPNRSGSSVAITIVKDKKDLAPAIKKALKEDREVLVEEYLQGKEITVATLGNENPQALPVIEIVPNLGEFYDYDSKYKSGGSTHHLPARISRGETKLAQKLAIKAHQALGCRGAARTDFILTSKGGPIALETNTIPGMTPTSLLPEAAKSAGIPFPKLLDKLIELALEK